MKRVERTFISKLKKADPPWFTFENEQGRVVTNCYKQEKKSIEEITGLSCEILNQTGNICQVAPKLI